MAREENPHPVAPLADRVEECLAEALAQQFCVHDPDIVFFGVVQEFLHVRPKAPPGFRGVFFVELVEVAETQRRLLAFHRNVTFMRRFVGEYPHDRVPHVLAETFFVNVMGGFHEVFHRFERVIIRAEVSQMPDFPTEGSVLVPEDLVLAVLEIRAGVADLPFAAPGRPVILVVKPDLHAESPGVAAKLLGHLEPFFPHVFVLQTAAGVDEELVDPDGFIRLERPNDVGLGGPSGDGAHRDQRRFLSKEKLGNEKKSEKKG
ncbi:MAG: hypothetical protein ACI4UF_09460 [Thermoguttaceae bacterium]